MIAAFNFDSSIRIKEAAVEEWQEADKNDAVLYLRSPAPDL